MHRCLVRNVLWLFAVMTTLFAAARSAEAEVPGVVVDYSPPSSGIYLGNPSIAILSNGDYVVSHDAWGPGHPYSQTYLFRSEDDGMTWEPLPDLNGQYESTLFVHDDALYLLGGSGHGTDVGIRKSTDGGQTWTVPNGPTTGQLLSNGRYNMGATPVVAHGGRIWRAMEEVDPNMPSGTSMNYRVFFMSAPADADLLDAANWTASNSLLLHDSWPNHGWLESGAVVAPGGNMVAMARVGYAWEQAARVEVSADGATATFDPNTGIVDFPGGGSKFTIRYDPQTERYWSLVNKRENPPAVRNVLALTSSADLVHWSVEATILEHPDSENVGFQYVDWQFEGKDIVAVSRTAIDGAPNFHDSNYTTFHRINHFRSLAQQETVALDAVADTQIREWVNYGNTNFGDANALSIGDYPSWQKKTWGLFKWDVSGFDSSTTVADATFQIHQAYWTLPAGEIEVYAINSGNWDESTVTWNNWVGTEDLTLLGTMPVIHGECTFSDPDLADLVQAWIDGDQENHGLVLQYHSVVGEEARPGHDNQYDEYFGNFYTKEYLETYPDSGFIAPRLVIDYLPAPPLEGDLNGDGFVGGDDLDIIRSCWGQTVPQGDLAQGDASGDGFVGGDDLDVVRAHWGEGAPPAPAGVPEPSLATMLAAIGLAWFMKRRNLSPRSRPKKELTASTPWACDNENE